MPNGGYTSTGSAEYIDYGNGSLTRIDLPQFLKPPAPLPRSDTEGRDAIDIYSNVFGNFPTQPIRYVERPKLEAELLKRLRDRNHTIVTLHGRGGIGKTSLALHICDLLSREEDGQYEYVIWLSARDLELKPSGASEVRRAVANLNGVASALAKLFDVPMDLEVLAKLLQDPKTIKSYGVLLVFDNFETLDNPRECHRFLDTHTHIPNKVLITSRERSFKGDFPIEVGGMERSEAEDLLRQEAASLCIDSDLIARSVDQIYEFTDGHPYVMRVLLGEIAKEGRWVPLKSLAPRRSDILNVVFERSFNKMSSAGRWVFLTVANWRSAVTELSLFVVLGLRDIDVDEGIEECLRLSLLSRYYLADGSFCYLAPELARVFAKKKLEGDPDRLLIVEDLEAIRSFGTLQIDQVKHHTVESLVQQFIDHCISAIADSDNARRQHLDGILNRIADEFPAAWIGVAKFRQMTKASASDIDYAYRRSVEERPFDKNAWIARADYARERRDDTTMVAAMVSAVEADPSDVAVLRDTAFELCKYLDAHKHQIPQARRGVYLASVRTHMTKVADKLDSTGLSRLAWLYLLEGDEDGANKFASKGLELDAQNAHCQKIANHLMSKSSNSSSFGL